MTPLYDGLFLQFAAEGQRLVRIGTNISALQAQRYLAQTTRAVARALERLSSGQRINRASDDVAGLGMSTRLESESRSLTAVVRNINSGYGLLATADGALSSQVDVLQRMRELAVQSANGTLSSTDRSHLETEFQGLLAEFSRISETASFNGRNLLDGSLTTVSLQVGIREGQTIEFSLDRPAASGSTTVYTGDGTIGLDQTLTADSTGSTYAVDLNGDGHQDLFSAGFGASDLEYVYLNNGDGTFGAARTFDFGLARAATFADVNDDGHMDIAVSETTNDRVKVFLGSSNGNYTQSATVNFTALTFDIDSGDFDGDGNIDLAIVDTTTVKVLLGDGAGNFGAGQTIYTTAGVTSRMAVGDFNGDGRDDIVAADSSLATADILWYNGSAFTNTTFSATENNDFSIADLDLDGDMDILGTSTVSSGRYQTFLNNGSGIMSPSANTVFVGVNSQRAVTDFDGDGRVDLIVNDTTNSVLKIKKGQSDGSFSTTTTTITTSLAPSLLQGADLNGDGYGDLLAHSGGDIYLYYQGTTETEIPEVLSVATQPYAQDALDILDRALEGLSADRSSVGSLMNRLEIASSHALLLSQNISEAKSRVLDADIAEETAELMRAQIMQQAGVSVLAQANLSMQIVLNLLTPIR